MNNENEFYMFINSLTGPQAKIILVYLAVRGGMTIQELKQRTGVKDLHTLQAACDGLSGPPFEMLVKQTMDHNKFVWLPAGGLLPMMSGCYFGPVSGISTNWKSEIETELKYLSTNNNNNLSLRTESLLLELVEIPLTGKVEPEHQNPSFDACLKACRAVGIGDPSASQIADLRNPDTFEFMTPELITAQAKLPRRPGQNIGLVIHRLKDWQPLPGSLTAPALLSGQAVADEISKFFPNANNYDDEAIV